MMNFWRLYVFILLGFISSFSFTNAATIYIDPGIATIYRGDAITTSVRLMPDKDSGECINTVDAVISYPENIQPVDISIGRSIFNVWVESPVINKENRTITFAGGIPNGYCGRVDGDPGLTNVIADIVFRSPGFQVGIGGSETDDNVAVISFLPETSAYLNDGQGTKAELRTLSSTITLEKTAGSGIQDDWREVVQRDDFPPEQFSITLATDTAAFGGKYFIVFSTTDKQTGISHYEVIEEPASEFGRFEWGRTDAPWIRVDGNTYLLKDQSLNSIIRVKAFDKAGNEYIATLIPDIGLRTVSDSEITYYVIIGTGVFLVSLIIGLIVFFYKRRKKLINEMDESDDSEE